MSFYRKRAALACDFCRSRKRRCDGRKPTCSHCSDLEVECHYDDAPSQRIDTAGGRGEILDRLRGIEVLLEKQSEKLDSLTLDTQNSPMAGQLNEATPQSHTSLLGPRDGTSNPRPPFATWAHGSLYESSDVTILPPLTIPARHKTSSNYLLGLTVIKSLIGDNPPDLFYQLESSNPLPPELCFDKGPAPPPIIDITRERADELTSIFFSTAHNNHPVLDQHEFQKIYQNFLENEPDSGVECALCMVVLALGSVCESVLHDPHSFASSPPGMQFMQHAMPTLISQSSWSFSYNLLLPQALVLASLYFAYIVRPLQSWRLIYSASNTLQFKLSGSIDTRRDGPNAKESVIRLFWSCFLVECDRLAELELPQSGLQQLTDEISLPDCTNLGLMQSTCYLAEISVRRLLNRIHNSLYPNKAHILSLSSTTLMTPDDYTIKDLSSMETICDELLSQLEIWHTSIPEDYRPTLGVGSPAVEFGNREAILRIRYFAARHIICRPFVLYITTHPDEHISESMMKKAATCIDSCRHYIHNTTLVLQQPSPYTWTFSLSSLGAIIVLTLAALSKDLQHLVADIDMLQTVAIDNIRPWAFSSLEAVVSILEDIQRKYQRLSRMRKH